MTAAEKLQLVNELWAELASHPSQIPVTREQLAEIERRMTEYRLKPSEVTTWEAIRQRVLSKASAGE